MHAAVAFDTGPDLELGCECMVREEGARVQATEEKKAYSSEGVSVIHEQEPGL